MIDYLIRLFQVKFERVFSYELHVGSLLTFNSRDGSDISKIFSDLFFHPDNLETYKKTKN